MTAVTDIDGVREGAGTDAEAFSSLTPSPGAASSPARADALPPVVVWQPGSYHCCDRCQYVWHDSPWPIGCPNCKAAVHWIASFYSRERAELYIPLTEREA